MDGETGEQKVSEDFAGLSFDELKLGDSWGNLYPMILKANRTNHQPPEDMEEADAEEWKAE